MTDHAPSFYVIGSHSDARKAVDSLVSAGCDAKLMSLNGLSRQINHKSTEFFKKGDQIGSWGDVDSFWDRFGQMLRAPALETALQDKECLLVVHGDAKTQAMARSVLADCPGLL